MALSETAGGKAVKVECPVCHKQVALLPKGVLRAHGYRNDTYCGTYGYCEGSGMKYPKVCEGCQEEFAFESTHACPASLKLRDGDQPLPQVNEYEPVQDQVIRYIRRRKEVGIKRYGTPLQPFNGRDALRDAFEEAVDLTQYLGQLIIERDGQLPGAG